MTQRAENTKKQILAAAEAEFAEKGLYGARVDEIAARAAVNKRMLYAYFGDKEQLYVAVIRAVYDRLAAFEAELLVPKAETEEQRIRLLVHRYFDFLCDTPTFVKIIMWENLNEGRYLRASGAAQSKREMLALLRAALRAGVESGEFCATVDLDEVLLSINLLCFSYFSNLHTFAQLVPFDLGTREQIARRADHVSDMLLKYLK